MFARNVSINLKPNTVADFTKTMDGEILSLLRNQKGFQGEVTLCVPGGREVVATSFWEHKENAETYNTSAYPEVVKLLSRFIEGTPQVKNLEVISSTYEKAAAHVAA
jgi:heme-degrading monooxygenase HmoA